MKLVSRWKAASLHERLLGLALTMVCFTTLVASPAAIMAPGVVPMVLEVFGIMIVAALLSEARWSFRQDTVDYMKRSGTSVAAIAFLLFSLLSCLFSHNRAVSIQGALQIGVGVLLYFVVGFNVRHTYQIARLILVLALIEIVTALIGCIAYSAHPVGQAAGQFGDSKLYASFLMVLLPFAAMSALTEKAVNRQLAAQIAAVGAVIALFLAHSSSAWNGAAIGLVAMGVLAALYPERGKKAPKGKAKLVVPGVLITTGLVFFWLASPMSASLVNSAINFNSTNTNTSTYSNASNHDLVQNRQQVWRDSLQMISEHPVTGVGESMYPYAHNAYSRSGNAIDQGRPTLSNQTHNLYLQTAVEIGIPGTAALAALLATFLITAIQRLKVMERSVRRNILLGAIGATAAFAVDAFNTPSWQFGQIMLFFWLALAIGVACARQPATNDVQRVVPAVNVPLRFRGPMAAVGLVALTVLMPISIVVSRRLNGYSPKPVYTPARAAVRATRLP